MISGLRWLALEVEFLDPAAKFYREHLGLPTVREDDRAVAFRAGDSELVLRRPSAVPRGGLHTHYALSTPDDRYGAWYDRLSTAFDLDEHSFGASRSLYFYDTERNCVEIGQSGGSTDGSHEIGPDSGTADPEITGIFEVVLEVEALDRAEAFYTALGFEVVDRGESRRRTRLTAGPFDVELWEPQRGLAEARGGVHVDLGLAVADPSEAVARVESSALAIEPDVVGGAATRVRDPDGHWLTFEPST